MLIFLVAACSGVPDDPTKSTVPDPTRPWERGLPALEGGPRGAILRRSIVHLHSPWSHDACDGDPLPYGSPNEPCLQDLRAGLCDTRIDVAFLTDHPSEAAFQPYDDLFHRRDGDVPVEVDGVVVGNRIVCADGHEVLWLPGIEDEQMPVSLDRQVAGTDSLENDRLYNQADAEGISASLAAGGVVLMAHTEGRDLTLLMEQQDDGLGGIEIFNLHAMLAPDIRGEDLGLEPLGWVTAIEPFTSPDGTGEPDLLMLGILQEQTPSIEKWEALLARGPMTGVAGTDAHQNVLPIDLRDGERGDSYRRSLRWFSNHLATFGEGPDDVQLALETGRNTVVFELLGTPLGFDVFLRADDGAIREVGSEGGEGTLVVTCPTLHPDSPQGVDAPELDVRVFRDGAVWQTDCGEFPTDGAGTYRVRVDVIPRHLVPFLGDDPDRWMVPVPWIYSNAIRVTAP